MYEVCNADKNFKKMEEMAPGYLTAIMVLAYEAKQAVGGESPARTAKRSEDKVSIKYRYSSTQIDVSKNTFKEAIEKISQSRTSAGESASTTSTRTIRRGN